MTDSQAMGWFVRQIDRLQAERRVLDEKIAALSLAYETVEGQQPATRRRAVTSKRRRDYDGVSKVLAFLREHKQAASVTMVRRETKCSGPAALARLRALIKAGQAERVGRGMYRAVKS